MSDYTPHEATVHEAQALPVMLPSRLVGREAALAQVYSHLKENRSVLVHGPAGIGKTGLIARLAAAYTQQPGGVLWLRVDHPRLEELLIRVGRAYSVDEIVNSPTPLGMVAAVESTLRTNKPLIVLDGAIQPDVASRFISRCADGLPVVIVVEEELDGAWASYRLESLDADNSATLFKQEARITSDEHDPDIHGIVKLLGYMPFALIVAARAMLAGKQSPGEFYERLKQIMATAEGNGAHAALATSFRTLNGALQGLILMMGATFNSSASSELLSIISGAPEDSVEQALKLLTQLHLLERTQRYGQPYYRMHSLTHQYAQTWLNNSNRLEGLQKKVRDSIVAYAQKYSQQTTGAHDKLAAEMETFMALSRWASNQGEREVAAQLATALHRAGDFVSERGYLYEVQQIRAYGTASASAFPAYAPEGGSAVPSLDDIDESDYDVDEDALEDVDEAMEMDSAARRMLINDDDDDDDVDDEEIDADSDELDRPPFDDLDDQDDEFGLFDDDDSDELSSTVDDVEEEESPEDMMFRAVLESEGNEAEPVLTPAPVLDFDPDADIHDLRALLGAARQKDDTDAEVRILKAIGQQQIKGGKEHEAISTFNDILNVYTNTADNPGILETLDMISALLARTRNFQAAVTHATRGIKLAEQISDDETRMHLLMTQGDARQQLGESEMAARDYSAALEIARTKDDSQNEPVILYRLGYAHLDNNDPQMAVETWEHALTLFKQKGKRAHEGRVLGALGSAYGDLDRWAEAVNFHTSALYIAREIGDIDEETLQLGSLAYAATRAGQLGEAVLRYRQALHLAYEAEDNANIVSIIVDLCRLLLQSRRHASVADLLINEALELEPNDYDVQQLSERIASEKKLAEAYGKALIEVQGTARDYAANAYALLEE